LEQFLTNWEAKWLKDLKQSSSGEFCADFTPGMTRKRDPFVILLRADGTPQCRSSGLRSEVIVRGISETLKLHNSRAPGSKKHILPANRREPPVLPIDDVPDFFGNADECEAGREDDPNYDLYWYDE
jgi:hypothetical protein